MVVFAIQIPMMGMCKHQKDKNMKKMVIVTGLMIGCHSTVFAAGYKVCLFHDTEYAYIPQFNTCPWNSGNLPPQAEDFPPGPHHTAPERLLSMFRKRPNDRPNTVIVHSPECFGEHGGGMN